MRGVQRLPPAPLVVAPPRLFAELIPLLKRLRTARALVIGAAVHAWRLIPTVRALGAVAIVVTPMLTVAATLAITPPLIKTRRLLEIPFREIARMPWALIVGAATLLPPCAVTLVRTFAGRGAPLFTPVPLGTPLWARGSVRIPRRPVRIRTARRPVV